MTIQERYFQWMCKIIKASEVYVDLYRHLHTIDFRYTISMDGNRYEDGVSLRYRFGFDENIETAMITDYLDIRPCSVLEMMVALAMRMDNDIMDRPNEEPRTDIWFNDMISSLGLESYTDIKHINIIINKFMDREYNTDGSGGLFTVLNENIRSLEIWYQMHRYLRSINE